MKTVLALMTIPYGLWCYWLGYRAGGARIDGKADG